MLGAKEVYILANLAVGLKLVVDKQAVAGRHVNPVSFPPISNVLPPLGKRGA